MTDSRPPKEFSGILNEFSSDGLDLFLLNSIIKLLSLLNNEIVISNSDLKEKLNLTKSNIEYITDYLVDKGYIEFKNVKEERIFSLTIEGKIYYNDEIKNLNFEELSQDSPGRMELIDKHPPDDNIPSFIGCFISDKNGKTLVTFELFDGALDYYLKGHLDSQEKKDQLDIELIPLFVSALEKFSQEINIQDLSGFNIKGANLKMRTYSYDKYTVTFIINPHINLKLVEHKIKEYFNILFKKYKNELELSIRTGIIENISHLSERGREMLKELNKFVYLVEFKHIINELEFFDILYAKSLYNKLDILFKEFNLNFTITLEKIKQLKINLLKTILNEDLEELKTIITKTQEIKSKWGKI